MQREIDEANRRVQARIDRAADAAIRRIERRTPGERREMLEDWEREHPRVAAAITAMAESVRSMVSNLVSGGGR
ncbi:hypothetical protein [Microbacterium sp. USHLN272]|uniref:hypothetical protein n=1 Tax=Microbacterium sp. USHLN272 TaxID=3081287 RepID=UPI003015CB99